MERSIEIDPNREAESQRYLVMGAELITLKFRGSQYSVFEHITRPGYGGPPPDRHLTQDEGWCLLHSFKNTGQEIGRIRLSSGGVRNMSGCGRQA